MNKCNCGSILEPYLNLPTKCPSCGGTLGQEGVFFICPNVSCSGVIYGNIMRWIQSHALMGIGPAIIREMITHKYTSAADMYKITEKKWVEITGSDKIAKKVLQEVNRTKTVNLDSFLYGLNIDCLGSTNSVRLAKKFEKLDKVLMATAEEIETIDGIKTNAAKIEQGLKEAMPLINELLKHIKVNDLSAAGPLAGASICITGELWDSRPAIHKQIQNAGGEVKTSVGKGLTFLATEDASAGSSKLQKAAKLGVKIIDGNTLKKLLNGDKKWQEI